MAINTRLEIRRLTELIAAVVFWNLTQATLGDRHGPEVGCHLLKS